ncbi:hypothetical protein TELCIR_01911 [Teladorsagia circumcincta]|uniref:G domain-containing protein n=1 Tax=Teladorsagia circumcincta TaxID=45464 RepID=A0A2G9V2S2_TELCI|nr:hypothetical protein TELCIR_01911 [Teladorsagia circumcincta]
MLLLDKEVPHVATAIRDLIRGLDVAVIGAPNVGKSLLTNQLVRASVSSVSSKMDTTTQNIDAVLTEDDVQLILLDSPGTVGLRHAREVMARKQDRIVKEPETALQKAEHILVVQIGRLGTPSQDFTLHDETVKMQDEAWHEKFRTVINKPSHKVGFAETKRLFSDIRGWSNFCAVFFVSSLTGEGIDPLRRHLKEMASEKRWRLDEMTITTNVLQVVVDIHCEKERIGKLILGKGGQRIAEIGKRVNDHMSNLFARQLFVRILVKHNKKQERPSSLGIAL